MQAAKAISWLVGRWWFWILAVAILFGQPLIRTFARHAPPAPPVGAAVPEFHLSRENGTPIDPSSVSGRVWVAVWVQPGAPESDAILESLFGLQHRLRNMGDAIRLVTLATAPATPQALEGMAKAHHYNARVWLFASGDEAELGRLREAFGVPDRKTQPFVWLIDGKGRLRGAYDPKNLDPLVEDLSVLVNGS
jgi:cytochrome oxidase Cu insertion factor (SCO1/SenC/PrrC family)